MYVCTGFPTGVENMRGLFQIQNLMGGGGRGWGLESVHGGKHGEQGLKVLLKNACEGVHLLVTLPAISLQAYKFTKNELFQGTFQCRLLLVLAITHTHLYIQSPRKMFFILTVL